MICLSQIANTYQNTMEPMRGRRNIAILSPDWISGGGGWAPSEKPGFGRERARGRCRERRLDMPDLSQIAITYYTTMKQMRGRRNSAILAP